MQPVTQYAKSGDVSIAYQVFGEGQINLVVVPGFVSNVENNWDQPDLVRWMLRMGSYARVVMFDKRGTGSSDRVAELPGLDQRMDDLRAVMDAAGMEQAAVFGISEGGPMSALFAATYPARCRALVLHGSYPRAGQERIAAFLAYIDQAWGTGGSAAFLAPSRANDPAFQRWWGRFERLGASPAAAAALMRMNSQIDVSNILPTIRVPTLVIHRTGDQVVSVENGRFLAEHIPGARYIEVSGNDHLSFVGDNSGKIGDAIEEFLTGSRAPVEVDRVLATVLFTDIVGSTEKAVELTAAGVICSTVITPRSGAISHAFVVVRSKLPGTAFLPPSTVQRAAFAAPAPLPKKSNRLASKSVPGCIPASAKWSMTMSAVLPFTSARVSLCSPVRARCWCQAP